jgi:diguanylate cyclase (GGDEF)-like protein
VIGLEKYAVRRIRTGKLLILPTLISVCLMAAVPNMTVLVRMLPFLNIVLLINMAAVVVIMIRRQQYRPWLIIPAVLLTLSLLQLVLLTALSLSLPLVLQYVILTTALILGISMITEYNQLLRENSELEQMADRDPLTGVYNRNILRRITLRPQDVLVVMDLDSLKQYNDRFGHPEGDRLLMSLTETINSNLRQSDMVIRYGGDEFIIILRDANVEACERVVQRINKQFSELSSANWASFSYGIEAMGETLAQTLACADENMYHMKKSRKLELA